MYVIVYRLYIPRACEYSVAREQQYWEPSSAQLSADVCLPATAAVHCLYMYLAHSETLLKLHHTLFASTRLCKSTQGKATHLGLFTEIHVCVLKNTPCKFTLGMYMYMASISLNTIYIIICTYVQYRSDARYKAHVGGKCTCTPRQIHVYT